MNKKPTISPTILFVLVLGIPITGLAVYWLLRPPSDIEISDAPLSVARRTVMKQVGGVQRPQTDFAIPEAAQEVLVEARRLQRDSRPKGSLSENIDQYPVLKKSMNANVKAVIEAVELGDHPERLTPNIAPPPFGKTAYQTNPQAYLDVVEPGRVYQSAEPGPGVKSIGVVGKRRHTIKQGESVRLAVTAPPNYPVTFTSLDLGAFDNHLPTITVVAGDDGVAGAAFTGTIGTTDDVNILAASPMASGRIEFVVTILE